MKGSERTRKALRHSTSTSPTSAGVYVASMESDDHTTRIELDDVGQSKRFRLQQPKSVVIPMPQPLKKRQRKLTNAKHSKIIHRTISSSTPQNPVFLPASLVLDQQHQQELRASPTRRRPVTAPWPDTRRSNQTSQSPIRLRRPSTRQQQSRIIAAENTANSRMADMVRAEKQISRNIQDEIEAMKSKLPLDFLFGLNNASLRYSRGLNTISRHLYNLRLQFLRNSFRQWVTASNQIAIEARAASQLSYNRSIKMSRVGEILLQCIRQRIAPFFAIWKALREAAVLHERTVAATRLQQVVRKVAAINTVKRLLLEAYETSVVNIQKVVRGRQARKSIAQSKAANTVQYAWRRRCAIQQVEIRRALLKQQQNEQFAINTLTKFFKVCLFKLQMSSRYHVKLQRRIAALTIQRAFRAMKARMFSALCRRGIRETEAIVKGLMNSSGKKVVQHVAASVIQRSYKLYVRKVAQHAAWYTMHRALDLMKQPIAATCIQNAYREYRLKLWMQQAVNAVENSLHQTAMVLQSIVRMFIGKLELQKLKAEAQRRRIAATTIQSLFRGHRSRQYAAVFRKVRTDAAIVIQQGYRSIRRLRLTRRVIHRQVERRKQIRSLHMQAWSQLTKSILAKREEERMLQLWNVGINHHRRVMLRNHYAAWLEPWKASQGARYRKRQATKMFRAKLLARAMQKWIHEWDITKAWKHWTRVLLFLGLKLSYYNSSRQQECLTNAKVMHRKHVLSCHSRAWKEIVQDAKENFEFASRWHLERFISRAPRLAFRDWTGFVVYSKHRTAQNQIAYSHYAEKLKARLMIKWKRFLKYIRAKKRNIILAMQHYKMSCKRSHYMRWSLFTVIRRDAKQRINDIIRSKNFAATNKAFQILHQYTKHSLHKKAVWKRVNSHMQMFRLNRIVKRWSVFSAKQWRARRLMSAMRLQVRWRIRSAKLRKFREKMKVAYAEKVVLENLSLPALTDPCMDEDTFYKKLQQNEFSIILFAKPYCESQFKRVPQLGVPRALLLRTVEHLDKQVHRLGNSMILPLSRVKPLVGVIQVEVETIGMEVAVALGVRQLPCLSLVWGGWSGFPRGRIATRQFMFRMSRAMVCKTFTFNTKFKHHFTRLLQQVADKDANIDISHLSKVVVDELDKSGEFLRVLVNRSATKIQTVFRKISTQHRYRPLIKEWVISEEKKQFEQELRKWELTGWEKKVSQDNKTFYWNHKIGVSLPIHPDAADPAVKPITLGVVTPTGLTFVIDTKLGNSVVDIKNIVKSRLGILPGYQRLALRPVGIGPASKLIQPQNNKGPLATLTVGWEVEVLREPLQDILKQNDARRNSYAETLLALNNDARIGGKEWIRGTIVAIQDNLYTINPGQGEGYLREVPRSNIRLIELPNDLQLASILKLVNGSLLEVQERQDPDQKPSVVRNGLICTSCKNVIAKLRCIECVEVLCYDCCWEQHMEREQDQVMSRAHRFVPIDVCLLDLSHKPRRAILSPATNNVIQTGSQSTSDTDKVVQLEDKQGNSLIQSNAENTASNKIDTVLQTETKAEPKLNTDTGDEKPNHIQEKKKPNLNLFRRRKSNDPTGRTAIVAACDVCSVQQAKGWCKSCTKFYCDLCFQSEHRVPAASNVFGSATTHQVILVSATKELEEAFPSAKKWDALAEFHKVLKSRGWWTQQLLDDADARRQAELDAVTEKREQVRAMLLEAFEKYDHDKSGGIDSGEFHSMLRDEFCEPISREKSLEAFESLDKDGSGLVEFEEFLNWYMSQVEEGVLGSESDDPMMARMKKQLERKRKLREIQKKAAERIRLPFGRKKQKTSDDADTVAVKEVFVPGPVQGWPTVTTICVDHFDQHKDRYLRYLQHDLKVDVNVTRFLKSSILHGTFQHVYCIAWNFGLMDATYYLQGQSISHHGMTYVREFNPETGFFAYRCSNGQVLDRNPVLAEKHVHELTAEFSAFDEDNSGFLDRQELRKLLREQLCIAGHQGADVTDKLLQTWNAIDSDGNGAVSLDEFITWYLFALENRDIHEDATLKMYKMRREFKARLRRVLKEFKLKVKQGLMLRQTVTKWAMDKIAIVAPGLLPADNPKAIKGPKSKQLEVEPSHQS